MKLKTSKILTNIINKEIKKDIKFKDYNLTRIEMTQDAFSLYVDFDIFNHEIDYNINNNKFNVIRISYPQNYYACDRYLTTKDLTNIFKQSDKTFNGFIEKLKNYIEI